jgi:hypothetical protein
MNALDDAHLSVILIVMTSHYMHARSKQHLVKMLKIDYSVSEFESITKTGEKTDLSVPCRMRLNRFGHRGGDSPLSRKFLYQNNAASKPCDLLANLRSSTCLSTHSTTSAETVTLILGLFSERMYYSRVPNSINIDTTKCPIILLSSTNGLKMNLQKGGC